MKVWGWILIIGSVVGGLYASFMDTSISDPMATARVENLGLLNLRLVITLNAGFNFVAGVILVAMDALRTALLSAGAGTAPLTDPTREPNPDPSPGIGLDPNPAWPTCEVCRKPTPQSELHTLVGRRYCGDCYARALT